MAGGEDDASTALGECRFSPTIFEELPCTILSDGTHIPADPLLADGGAAATLADDRRVMMSLMDGTLVLSYSVSNTFGMLSRNGVDNLRIRDSVEESLGDPTLRLLDTAGRTLRLLLPERAEWLLMTERADCDTIICLVLEFADAGWNLTVETVGFMLPTDWL